MMMQYEEFGILEHNDFIICLTPKVASTTLRRWHRDMGGEVKTIKKHGLESKKMYALWRPPYERIFIGLHTGCNTKAGRVDPEGGEENKKEYIRQFYNWIDNGMFDYSTKYYSAITEHTQLLQTLFGHRFYEINFIHIQHTNNLHNYLNVKHKVNLEPVTGHYNKSADHGDRANRQSVSLFNSLLLKNPKVYRAITAYAAQDYVPERLIDISKF